VRLALGWALRIALQDPALLCLDLYRERGFGFVSLSSKHVEAFSLRERSRRRLLGSRGPQESHQGGRV
jgi:hypothetical protein